MDKKKVEVFLNKYEGTIEHPELSIVDLGVKSMYIPGKGGGTKRLFGRHITIEGPEYLVRSYLEKLRQDYDAYTDL